MAEILSLVLKRHLNLSELCTFQGIFPGDASGEPPKLLQGRRPLCSLQSHNLLNAKNCGIQLKMRWDEHEKIAILESQFWKDQILWVLKCLQNYKVCIEKNCCSFKFIDICPEILLLSCLAISRPFPSSPPSADTWIPSESGSRCRVLIPVFFRCQDRFITN